MAATARRRPISPSPVGSPTPSAVSLLATGANRGANRDGSSAGTTTNALRSTGRIDAASPLSASHASLITEQAQATLSTRPIPPLEYRPASSEQSATNTSLNTTATTTAATTKRTKTTSTTTATIASASNARTKTSMADSTSLSEDRAAERAFYRRILFQNFAPSQEVPQITPDASLDHEIYLLLAYLLRETVLPWYSKLTPDRELLTQIVNIIVDIVHTLLQRLSTTQNPADPPLASIHRLLSLELPLILQQHYVDFRQAQHKAGSVWAPLVSAQLFHSSSPHPGIHTDDLGLDGRIELDYLRIAVLALLSSVLPADEFAPDTEKFVVRDVLVTVLRGALGKPTRPWFVVQSLNKVLDATGWCEAPLGCVPPPAGGLASDSFPRAGTGAAARSETRTSFAVHLANLPALLLRLWTFLVLRVLPFLVRAYLDLFNVHRANRRRFPSETGSGTNNQPGSSTGGYGSSMSRSVSVGSLSEKRMHGRFPSHRFDTHLSAAGATPLNSKPNRSQEDEEAEAKRELERIREEEEDHDGDDETAALSLDGDSGLSARYPYVASWLGLVEEAIETRTRTLLSSVFAIVKVGLAIGGFDWKTDLVVMSAVLHKATDPVAIAKHVRLVRKILLPNGHLSPPVPDPSPETQDREYKRLRARLLAGTPAVVRRAVWGRDAETQFAGLSRWLEPVCSPQAAGPNTLLGILVLERLIAVLCPDLVESS
ncbi:hypothetical protein BCV70DRAFT_227887 [Testicularia cyperi]|uniref:PXA domain-containing protein n=1 Tax=Testicularia cyperi TaxID=1882483 RepID=A0A317XL36_9BASI|nr:hypothetical protein BCV70DRAFT_227887 [Testicularia cyperi]